MEEERIRMRLSIIETEEKMGLITLRNKDIPPFVASIGGFNYKGEHNQVTLLRTNSTTNFPGDGGTYITEIREIVNVIIHED